MQFNFISRDYLTTPSFEAHAGNEVYKYGITKGIAIFRP